MNIRNLLVCSCWALSSKTRERNYTRDIRACANSLVPENGNGKLKLNGNAYGTARSIHHLFNYRSIPVCHPLFFKTGTSCTNRGELFFTPTEHTVYCICTQTVPQVNNNFTEIVIYHIFSIISHSYNKFQLVESVTSI